MTASNKQEIPCYTHKWQRRKPRREKREVAHLTLGQVFAAQIEGARARAAHRAACRSASPGEAPGRLWSYETVRADHAAAVVAARTKSEARAKIKALMGVDRLPAGAVVGELKPSSKEVT